MDTNELRSFEEAYLEVVNNQQLDEADSLAAMQARREKRLARQRKQMGTSSTGQDFGHDYGISSAERKKRQQAEFDKFVGRGKKTKTEDVEYVDEDSRRKALRQEEVSVYDIVLSHLIDEGYAETVESAEGIMVNMSEEWRDSIMEISQKTAIKAYAQRATGEFETDGDNPRDFTKSGKSKSDETHRRIKNKFGKKAGRHANRAAHASVFGRNNGLLSMPKKP